MNPETIKQGKFSIVYLTTEDCQVCEIILPRIEKMIAVFPQADFQLIKLDDVPEAAGSFLTFSVPTLLVYSNGAELLRFSRYLDVERIGMQMKKYYDLIFETDKNACSEINPETFRY
ncbi:MAG TPA: thioredoxin family protein [Candidatus Cloacimonadota bacterium]|nr:thioredoxin family protein [Candidatus Cloacimonadota bacterium]